MAYQEGDRAYIIENNLRVTPVSIAKRSGDFYTVALSHHCWITVRESRLYRTEEEAKANVGIVVIPKKEEPEIDPGYKSPYTYDNHRSPYGI